MKVGIFTYLYHACIHCDGWKRKYREKSSRIPLHMPLFAIDIENESLMISQADRTFATSSGTGTSQVWELREFFKYATSLVIVLSLYMFQFTMLFTN